MRFLSLAVFLVVGCSGVQVKQRPDGTYTVQCSDHKACLDRADRLCGAQGYVVVGGRSNKKLYGVPGNEKYIGKDEIYVRCNKDRPLDTPDPATGSWRLQHDENETAPAKPATKTICRPGETQRCVGKGACNGGQACLKDGSGFGSCECAEPSSGTPAAAGAAAVTNVP